jgi:Tol biopolymer transport system component
LVYRDYPETKGANLVSAPRFSPVNNNLLLYRFIDESDDEKIKFGVADWTTGDYMLMYEGEYDSVAWEPDGSVVASVNKGIYRFTYQGGSFADPVQIFTTPNAAKYLDVSADGSKYLFTMSGRIFWCLVDGSELTQVTAPPATGLEYRPKWSPDGTHIMFMKDDQRYIISADSHNLRISLDVSDNASKAKHITREGGRVGYWRP